MPAFRERSDEVTIGSWLTVPALVTQGTNDTRVPTTMALRLRQLRPSLVTLALFPRAGHLESWNINRDRYTSLVATLLSPVAP